MTTELLTPNSLSKGLSKSLKEAGSKIDTSMIAERGKLLEESRASYQANCLYFGILCLAKKLSLKHGQWIPERAKWRARSPFSEHSIKVYMQLAKRFLIHLEQGDFNEEFKERKMRAISMESFERDAFQIEVRRESTIKNLEKFIAGRSLRDMLSDYREADKAAEAEYFEEVADRQKDDGIIKAGGENPGGSQYSFFDQLNADIEPAFSKFEHVLGELYWLDENISSKDKLAALQQLETEAKNIVQKIADKAAAIKKGAANA